MYPNLDIFHQQYCYCNR